MNKILNNQGKIKFEDKSNEDKNLLKSFDDIFREKRGYVIRLPKPGDTVVACMSGGLDSTANIGILLKEFKLKVYPFFVNRKQSALRWEREAVNFFDQYYQRRFPDQYHKCLEIKVSTPAEEYKDLLRKTKKMMIDIPLSQNISYPARNPIIFLTGAEYAYSLKAKGEYISTLFASHVSSDGSFHCSQTWTRLMNVLMCQIFNDWNFQFISLPIETELGNFFDKDVYIQFMIENSIPIEKTRTCTTAFRIPCGDCPPCWDTRRILKELHISDKRKYLFPMSEKFPTYYTHEKELARLLSTKSIKKMKKEIEVKIELTPEEFRDLAGDFNNAHFERTFGYFKEDFSNIKERIFPRIKYMEGKNKDILLTVKRKTEDNAHFFEREEMEVKLEEGENVEILRKILKSLGFSKEIIFEKKRKNVFKDDMVISFDELPFGFFVEFEGEPEVINKYLNEFNFSNRPRITRAYLGLWEDYRKTHNVAEENCVFK